MNVRHRASLDTNKVAPLDIHFLDRIDEHPTEDFYSPGLINCPQRGPLGVRKYSEH